MLFGEGPQIKNIAADLNKLFRQGSLLNQSVQTAEGDSAADQGTSDLLAARDPVIQEISVGMSGEQSARYTVSGTPPLSLPNSLGKPLKAWSVDVLPYQEGTGDPSPDNVRPIHGTDKVTVWTSGKNLYNMNDDQYGNGLFWQYSTGQLINSPDYYASPKIPVMPNTAYVRNEGANASIYFDKNGTWLSSSSTGRNFTTPSNAYYVGFNISNSVDHSTVQLELGSVSTEYTPYQSITQTVLTLPQTVYTGTIGSEGGESRSEEIDLATLPSTSWRFGNALTDGTGYYVYITGTVSNPTTIISDRYVRASVGSWEALSFGQFMATTYLIITVPNECNTLESAKDYLLNTNKPQFVMSLSTPTTFAVPSVTIPTPTGTATTWATAEDGTVDGMEVTYVGKA